MGPHRPQHVLRRDGRHGLSEAGRVVKAEAEALDPDEELRHLLRRPHAQGEPPHQVGAGPRQLLFRHPLAAEADQLFADDGQSFPRSSRTRLYSRDDDAPPRIWLATSSG